MNINDRVIYDGGIYIIEKDYGNKVYLIGNLNSFCDMVPEHLLEPFDEVIETKYRKLLEELVDAVQAYKTEWLRPRGVIESETEVMARNYMFEKLMEIEEVKNV